MLSDFKANKFLKAIIMGKEFMEFIDEVLNNGVTITKNKCTIDIHSPMGVNKHVLKVDPLNVKCESLRHDDDAEYEAIKWAIDFDKWQHSWHNEVKPENYDHFLEIIKGKVIEKSAALVQLNCVAIFLENKIRQIGELPKSTNDKYEDYEPF